MTTLSSIRNAAIEDAGAGGLTVYATKEDLPSSGLTAGDQAYVSASSRLYVSNGSGWYNVALINATPSLSIDPTGTIALSITGETTTITLTATDSDNAVAGLTYSVESDGSFGGLGTISQDSSVFTITPLSEDSATTASAVLTFKASDGINFGSGDRTLTLSFKVENSNYTTLLAKADTADTDNQVDASTNTHTITENGNVTSTAFTPYHPGGYSVHFNDGYYDIAVTDSTDFDFGTGDFTMEGWYYCTNSTTDNYLLSFSTTSGNGHFGVNFYQGSWRVGLFNGSLITGTTGVESNVWHHFAWVRESGVFKFYIDGTQVGSDVSYSSALDCSGTFKIGAYQGSVYGGFWGYLSDIRIVKGTAVYTGNFTAPTGRLTAISNTVLLACHLPYFADGSSSDHTLTPNPNSYVNGDLSIKRFGPYDYLGYTKANHGGSVYLDGSGDYLITGTGVTSIDAGDYTVELWWYPATTVTQQQTLLHFNAGGSGGTNIWCNTSGQLVIDNGTVGQSAFAGANFVLRQWNHVVVTRSGSTTTGYINGVVAGSNTYTPAASDRVQIGRYNSTFHTVGYIADFRYVAGTVVYTSAFTPPTATLTAITNTQLLTCTNKNDIWDASSGNLLTKSGDVTSSDTQRKFISSSATYFDGTGDSISFTAGYDDPLYNFGTHDWTLEGWFYIQTLSGGRNLFSFLRASANEATPHIYTQNTDLRYYVLGTDRISGSSALTVNTWHHIAATRSGNDHKLFVDGTQVGGTWTNAQTYVQGRPVLGDYHSSLGNLTGGSNLLHGYAQDFRITKGLARYTSNFTPPTTEFDG
jgi:hypothetical protein